MKVVLIYLDDDGYESYREVLSVESAYRRGYGSILEDMLKNGFRVMQFNDVIVEVIE